MDRGDEHPWWAEGVFYQIYPRSFQDSNDDGIGDLPGVASRLEHLEWLGVDAIWLNPVHPSPNADWGYDVADYLGVHPDLGSIEDLDELVDQAASRGMKVVLDLVPNHTSDQHEWFRDALTSRHAAHRDWYVWADGRDGGPPNNWRSVFGGDLAWEFHEPTRQWYLHNFLAQQPDLNWWNEEVRVAFDDILRFWFGRGIAGFRIDVAHGVVKDRHLRDNPPATQDDDPHHRFVGQLPVYNMNRPEVHDVLRRWRAIANSHSPPRALIGETWVLDVQQIAPFYGENSDELHLGFNFPFAFASLDEVMKEVVAATQRALPEAAWPAWAGSNHDVGRLATRWCAGDERKVRCALMALLALRGTPFLYYGDEIGLEDQVLTAEQLRDPVGKRFWPADPGRDGGRTPMRWSAEAGAGFSHAQPWLPIGDVGACNVEDQRRDPGSILSLCRDLIRLRRAETSLRRTGYEELATTGSVWAWRRGHFVVALNLGEDERAVDVSGTIRIGTRRTRDGGLVQGMLELGPWEGAIVESV